MKSWPKVKLCQVGVSLNIAQNHSSSPYEVISGNYLPQFTWKVDQKWNYVKLKSVRTLLRIAHMVHRKSYLVIIWPNLHENLKVKLGQFGVGSIKSQNHSSASSGQKEVINYLVIVCPNSHEKFKLDTYSTRLFQFGFIYQKYHLCSYNAWYHKYHFCVRC